MKEIQLTQGMVALVDDEDFEWLNQWKWSLQMKGKAKSDGLVVFYAARTVWITKTKQVHISMHRTIMKADIYPNLQIDHIDRNGLNNQKSNLRFVNRSQNLMNKGKRNNCSLKYKGVYLCSGKWRSLIRANGKRISLGMFMCEVEAARAYDIAAIKYFGEFARTNFPRSEYGMG